MTARTAQSHVIAYTKACIAYTPTTPSYHHAPASLGMQQSLPNMAPVTAVHQSLCITKPCSSSLP